MNRLNMVIFYVYWHFLKASWQIDVTITQARISKYSGNSGVCLIIHTNTTLNVGSGSVNVQSKQSSKEGISHVRAIAFRVNQY